MKINESKLQLLRTKHGMSLKELGITPRIISRIRHGQELQARTIYRITQSLGCEVEDIIEAGGDVNGKESNSNESDQTAVH